MTKHFENLQAKAVAYAAYKELERMLKEDGEMPAGYQFDCSNAKITITLQDGIIVNRETGVNGKYYKAAAQNLYGYAILYQCFLVAKKFRQHQKMVKLLLKIVRRALKQTQTYEDAFKALYPREAKQIEEFKKQLKLPKREEDTPRQIIRKNKKSFPFLSFLRVKAA